MRTIGVISDTHGLLRDEALSALEGSDLILHAGDVGSVQILEELARIAPVRAVRGNTDWGPLAAALPGTDVVDLGADDGEPGPEQQGPLAYLLHDLELLDLDPRAAGFAVVIHGHTHEPLVQERGGVLYVNPGSAGHRRSRLPVTVARMEVEGGRLRAEIRPLRVSE